MAMPPDNDACDDAISIGLGEITGTTLGATQDGQSGCDGRLTAKDIWFKYEAGDKQTIYLSTENSGFDTILSNHASC